MPERLFVAVGLPEPLMEPISRWEQEAELTRSGWRLTPVQELHMTLSFFGATPQDRVSVLRRRLARLSRDWPGMQLLVRGWGVFPPAGRPRILWLGVAGELDALTALARATDEAAQGLIPDRSSRAFRPHITLARRRSQVSVHLPGRPNSVSPQIGAFVVDRMRLYRSVLTSAGARHEKIETFPLTGEPT